jgi:DNA polymerase III subunit gamma/tau
MSYQVIARKWRPQTFEEVTGQEAITRTLRNALEHDRLHHAYIFSGARGVGKTTTARLLAKALNCHKTEKPNSKPCAANASDACVSCKEIAESRSIDVLEIDAASHTGIDDVRDTILDSININPARDRYKVFIVDEVHQLSKPAFNALLKTLEEPPPRIVFVMATTELHRVPDTILSRCQEFEFRTIPIQKIYERIKLIAEAEKISVSGEALKEIARAGEGSMRDAQSAFDQVISFSGEKIGTEDVIAALGIAGAEMLTRTGMSISENKPSEALKVVDELIARGQDLRNFCRDLMSFFRDLLVFKMAGDAENLLETAILSRDELQTNSAPFSESDLIRFFNSLSDTETKLREATQPRYVLEIGLIKLIEMRRVVPIEKILERLAKLESAIANGNFSAEAKTDLSKSAPINLSDLTEPSAEKKTLTVDFPLEDVPFPVQSVSSFKHQVSNQPAFEAKFDEQIKQETTDAPTELPAQIAEPENIFLELKTELFESESQTSESRISAKNLTTAQVIEAMPIKLLPITAEELEHAEDNWLDSAFEQKLLQTGDNLRPFKNTSNIVEVLLGTIQSNNLIARIEPSKGNSAAAVAPAKENHTFVIPQFEEEKISEEIPVMPENPTDEQLWQYAENHPLVKKALRIFRGKIIEVKRTQPSN